MRALILSGGGVKGAYQIGILKYLSQVRGLSWDLVAGISVGALNGSFLAQYKPSEQANGIKNLEKVWTDIKGNGSIYKAWLPSMFPNIVGYMSSLWTGGLFSANPLRKLIKRNFSQKSLVYSGVKLLVGAVSITTGKCRFVREYEPNLLDWIIASSAFPVAFPPVKIDGDLWIDGGMRKDISPLELVVHHNPDEVDIVMTTPINGHLVAPAKNKSGALGVAIRTVQILNEESFPTSLVAACIQKGIKVNVYAPDQNLKVDLLSFSPDIISRLITQGYVDAQKSAQPA
jgi:NTE family protein